MQTEDIYHLDKTYEFSYGADFPRILIRANPLFHPSISGTCLAKEIPKWCKSYHFAVTHGHKYDADKPRNMVRAKDSVIS